jgi:hypothetical protein
MPREGAIIFRDLVGKLDVLNIECDKCGRRGRYRLDRLIERYGLDASSAQTGKEPKRYLWGAVARSVEGSLIGAHAAKRLRPCP